ncbi:MAG: hypothetical protein HC854_09155 [Flavobacterium sp.]|nr:hypothetical protein [Flavobacterium sp.]
MNENAFLRTDGFYVLESKWYKRNDKLVKPTQYEVYKFYKNGQVNFILLDSLKTDEEYVALMKSQIDEYGKGKNEYTLFQGYYKIQDNKIIIQQVNSVTRKFSYLYGFIEENKFSIVNNTIKGSGSFKDEYFQDNYKGSYSFMPSKIAESILKPNW